VTLYRKCSEALTFENVWQGQRALRLESARRAVLGLLKAHLSASFDHFIYNVRISRQARERAEQALHRMRIAEIAAAFNEFARVLLEQWEHRVAVRAALPHGLRLTYCGRALDLWRNAILNAHTKRVHRSKILKAVAKSVMRVWQARAKRAARIRQVVTRVCQRWEKMRYAKAFARWKEQAAEDHPTAVSVSMDLDFNSTLASSSERLSFEKQLQVDICGVLGIEVERVSFLCHEKGSIVSEIVLQNPQGIPKLDSNQLAHAFADRVGNPDSKLLQTPLGRHMTKAIVHGPICEQTVQALRRAKEAEESRAQITMGARSKRREYVTNKAVRQWQYQALGRAWARWEEQTTKQRKLRVAASKVVKRWTHKSQALAWGKWREGVRRSRVAKKAEVRCTQKALYAAWSTWGALVTEGKRVRTVGAKVCLRWQQRTMSGAWITWQCTHLEMRRLARAADKVLLRWQHMCLAPAWARWGEQWREEKRMRRAAETVLRRWQNMRMAPAFSGWREHAATQKRMALSADKIVMRRINLASSPVVSRWMGYVEEKKRLVRVADKVELRWQNMCLVPAWARWEEQTTKQRKLRVAASKVVKRWTHKSQALAWGKWREGVRRSRVAKKAEVRCTQKALYAAWSTWGALVTEGKRVRTVGAKVCLWWQQRTMSGAWITWQCTHSEMRRLARAADLRRLAVGRAVDRCRVQAIARAWAAWEEYMRVAEAERQEAARHAMTEHELAEMHIANHVQSRRRLDLACRLVRRMGKRDIATAVGRWSAAVQLFKAQRYGLRRVSERAKEQALARVFNMWHAGVRRVKRSRRVTGLVLRRHLRLGMSLALARWCSQHGRCSQALRLAARVFGRSISHCVVDVFGAWRSGMLSDKKKRQSMTRMIHKMLNRVASSALLAWRASARLLMTQKVKFARIIHKLMTRCFVHCFQLWQQSTSKQILIKEKSARIIYKLMNRCIVQGFELWQQNTREQILIKVKSACMIYRLINSCFVKCLGLWRANITEQILMKVKSVRMIQRLKNRCLGNFLGLWQLAMSHEVPARFQREMAHSCSLWRARLFALVRPPSLSVAFMQWLEFVEEHQGHTQYQAREDLHEQTLECRELEILQLREAIAERDTATQMLPQLVQVRLDLDFASTLSCSGRIAKFNNDLEDDVCAALSVSRSSVGVLSHERRSIIVQIVLSHPLHNARHGEAASLSDLAHQLVHQVQNKNSKFATTGLGSRCDGATIIGTLDVPVYEAMKKASEALLSSRRLSEAWERWEAYLEDVLQERAQEAQELSKQFMVEAEERHIEMYKRVVQRMLRHQLLIAWNMFVDTVTETAHNRKTVGKVLSRMAQRQLAHALKRYAGVVQTVLVQREKVRKTMARWKTPGLELLCSFARGVQESKMEREKLEHALTRKHTSRLIRSSFQSLCLHCSYEYQCAQDQALLVSMALRCWHNVHVQHSLQQCRDEVLVISSCDLLPLCCTCICRAHVRCMLVRSLVEVGTRQGEHPLLRVLRS
jgi:hypothetical protein